MSEHGRRNREENVGTKIVYYILRERNDDFSQGAVCSQRAKPEGYKAPREK
jgi:hypothetical protein